MADNNTTKNNNELTDEQLAQAAGGMDDPTTYMECSQCGCVKLWGGNYVGQTVQCPDCKYLAFTGKYLM